MHGTSTPALPTPDAASPGFTRTAERAVHVICDNLSAHKAPVVHKWLLAHPRFQLHFTPTYSSWINQVERWFAELERRCLARGVFCSLDGLKTALEDWTKVWNDEARPFKWTKTANQSSTASAATATGSPNQDTRPQGRQKCVCSDMGRNGPAPHTPGHSHSSTAPHSPNRMAESGCLSHSRI
ncbi:transposase [Streptomyces sp. NPDC029216]|uniref:transposase n=1 Tax=Streptomyces sp. NPDC029216 TaxID=3154701 RepID=UPI0033DC651E